MKKIFANVFVLFSLTCHVRSLAQEPFRDAAPHVQYQYIGTYDPSRFNRILGGELDTFMMGSPMPASSFRAQFAKPKYAVKLYRVKYRSMAPEYGNWPVEASGLVAIPVTGSDSMPMVSYQHGTVFSRREVPSFPDESMETKLMLAQFASQGYIVIGADYFGLGASTLPNSYLVRGSSEQACVDMLYAAQDVLKAMKIRQGPFFVHGWSQGGWTNMTFLRKLEYLGIKVTAAATASAPVDAFATMNRWMNNYQPGDAVYLPACVTNYIFAVEFYNQIPGLARTAIRPEYYQAAKDFYEFKIDWTTYLKLTRDKVKDVLKPEFLSGGDFGTGVYWLDLEKSQAYRWRCATPLVNYYGEKDEVVPVYIAKLAEGFHTLFGSNTTRAENAGKDADHRATFVYSTIHARAWFETFLRTK